MLRASILALGLREPVVVHLYPPSREIAAHVSEGLADPCRFLAGLCRIPQYVTQRQLHQLDVLPIANPDVGGPGTDPPNIMCRCRVHRLPLLLLILLRLLRSHPRAALIISRSVVWLPLLLLVRRRPCLPLLRSKPAETQVLCSLLSEIGVS
jgi:hypothetical protein